MSIFDQRIRAFGVTFLTAAAGGWIASLLHIPLAWLFGSLMAVAVANLTGFRQPAPGWSRQIGQVIAGVAVGLSFTPALAERLVAYSGYMVGAAMLSIIAGTLMSFVLAWVTRIDRTTAYFASLPGGVAEMSVLADRYGGQTALVALSQSLRVVLVVVTLPALCSLFGWHGTVDLAQSRLPLHPPLMVLMLAGAWLVAWVFGMIRVTNNWLLGGLVTGAVIGYFEIPLSRVAESVLVASQIMIGAALGSRFTRDLVLTMRRFIPATVVSTLVVITFTTILAFVFAEWIDLDVATLALALAPGGVAEMSLTARTLHLGGAEVTAFHLVRILLVILLTAPTYELARRWAARRGR